MDFSTQHVTSTLGGLFTMTGVKEMLERKGFSALHIVFSFIRAFLNQTTGYEGQPVLTEIKTIYSDIVKQLLHGWPKLNLLN